MGDPSFDPAEHVGNAVTFRGKAENAAAGAVITVGPGKPIYISGLRAWDPELEGRPVEVTGVVRRREGQVPPPLPGGIPRHGIPSATFVIDGAEWEAVG
jgi:hypothetical protein